MATVNQYKGVTIKTLILQGEGEQLDFKNKISSCAKIAKTLVAFANNKGGKLLVGVADNGYIKGVKNEDEERYMLQRAGHLYCRPAIDLHFDEIYVDDKLVLLAEVAESDTKPHYALSEDQRWWVYVRVKDKSVLAGKVVVDVLRRGSQPNGIFINYTEKEKELLEYVHTHTKSQLPELCKHLRLSRRKTQRILVNLIVAGVLQVHSGDHEEYYTENPV
ncbi:Putative DNA-binding domain-containing protein [Parapedobacter luteus]|uniref:Putative DNA-binding domain-containing protein n=1 Tax=Parapedobacter luteus TaxID=623280 RepID=A0A1T5ARC4_9SPHI|nr:MULTISPECIES: ATP-binding protein [Parapedobacter]SKB37153.1 Putative DNA-binding domain-containing protein [Parapedobacter luteus]